MLFCLEFALKTWTTNKNHNCSFQNEATANDVHNIFKVQERKVLKTINF